MSRMNIQLFGGKNKPTREGVDTRTKDLTGAVADTTTESGVPAVKRGETGRVIVIPGVDSDGNVTLHYYPVDGEDAEPEPEEAPVVDERSIEEIFADLDRLCHIGTRLERKLRKMRAYARMVEETPLIRGNPLDLLSPRQRILHQTMSRNMANPWCAQVVRELEGAVSLTVGASTEDVGSRPGVGVVVVDGAAMEVPFV